MFANRRALWLAALLAYGMVVDPNTGAVGLPCLWRVLAGVDCFACGLSRAGALLMRGRVLEAADMNLLIFPVALLVGWEFAGVVSKFRARGVEQWQN